MVYSVITPEVVTLATLLVPLSVNQMLPSGPVVMPMGLLPAVGIVYSVMAPVLVILPTLFPMSSVNQTLPSRPAAMPNGKLPGVGTAYSVTSPTAACATGPVRICAAATGPREAAADSTRRALPAIVGRNSRHAGLVTSGASESGDSR